MPELKTINGRQWVKRPATESGNTSLSKLSSETGVSAREIVEANGVVWAGSPEYVSARLKALGIPGAENLSFAKRQVVVRENDINEWVAKNNGICDENRPEAKGYYGTKVRGCMWGQWALLNPKSIIWLPARPQDIQAAASAAVKRKQATPWLYAGGAGLLIGLGVLYRRRQRRA